MGIRIEWNGTDSELVHALGIIEELRADGIGHIEVWIDSTATEETS